MIVQSTNIVILQILIMLPPIPYGKKRIMFLFEQNCKEFYNYNIEHLYRF
jgi:hypothetical protein